MSQRLKLALARVALGQRAQSVVDWIHIWIAHSSTPPLCRKRKKDPAAHQAGKGCEPERAEISVAAAPVALSSLKGRTKETGGKFFFQRTICFHILPDRPQRGRMPLYVGSVANVADGSLASWLNWQRQSRSVANPILVQTRIQEGVR